MDWRDSLRKASFRGVEFNVDSAQGVIGRRQARHEFPQRDLPYMEDMGRRAREFKIEAFVVGAEYMQGRDELIEAIEKEGAGQLVHPYLGVMMVSVIGEVRFTESTQHGGMVKFSIGFIESGEPLEPASETNTEYELDAQYGVCEVDIATDFAENFSLDGLADFAQIDALNMIQGALDLPGMALGNLASLASMATNPLSALSGLMPGNLISTLMKPLALATGILALVKSMGKQESNTLLSYTSNQIGANSQISSNSAGLSQTRQAIIGNQSAFNNLLLAAATTNQVADLAKTSTATQDEAVAARSRIVELTDALLFTPRMGVSTQESVSQLATVSIQHLAKTAPSLPRLISRVLPQPAPACVLAHDYYGDNWLLQNREDELILFNKIRHPGFVAAGEDIYLLSKL